jgi:hypothetical protein
MARLTAVDTAAALQELSLAGTFLQGTFKTIHTRVRVSRENAGKHARASQLARPYMPMAW